LSKQLDKWNGHALITIDGNKKNEFSNSMILYDSRLAITFFLSQLLFKIHSFFCFNCFFLLWTCKPSLMFFYSSSLGLVHPYWCLHNRWIKDIVCLLSMWPWPLLKVLW